MTDGASGSDTVSVVERTAPITISGGIVAAHFCCIRSW
jgi:hypothetical protein